MPFPKSNEIARRWGDRLPHWTADGAVYHVTFRLADSMPAQVLQLFLEEREAQGRRSGAGPETDDVWERMDAYLDRGHGQCLLARPPVAEVMVGAVTHFEGTRYSLFAWCVMPNHVHVVLQPLGGFELPRIIHSMKSYSAHAANELLGRSGPLWQPEYFDHLIRDEAALDRAVRYVALNPVCAGLVGWRWVWPKADQNPVE